MSLGWKTIFRYLRPYKKDITLLSFLGVFDAIAIGGIPYFIGKFLDSVLNISSTTLVFGFAISSWIFFLSLWATFQIISGIGDWFNDLKAHSLGTKISGVHFSDAVRRLLTLPLSFHKENKIGDTWDKIGRANNALINIVDSVIIRLTPPLLSVLIGIFFSFAIHWVFALVIVFGVFIYVVTLFRIASPIGELIVEGNKAWNEASGAALDAITNYQTVKQSITEFFEDGRVRVMFLDKAIPRWNAVEKVWVTMSLVQRVLIFVTQLIVLLLGVFFISRGELTVGSLIALNGYAALVFGPFVRLGYNWQSLQTGIIAIERAEQILGQEPENTGNKIKPEKIEGKVTFDHVRFSYREDGLLVLDDISFEVRPGEMVAFVGESGVGKSTAIDLISGYYFPQKGGVLIDGYDTKTVDLYTLRKYIAVVPQEVVLFNESIEDNIRYGKLDATDEELREAAKKLMLIFLSKNFQKNTSNLLVNEE